MDLSGYIKRSDSARRSSSYKIEKKCMQCGKTLEKDGNPFYYQRFCGQSCKEKYVTPEYY